MLTTELHHFFRSEDEFGDERLFESNTLLHLTNSILSSQRNPASDRVEWWRARNTLIRTHIEENLGDRTYILASNMEREFGDFEQILRL